MADPARRFMDEYAPSHLKPGTAALYRKIIDRRILPRLGKVRVADFGRADAAALHHDMRSVPGHANRTLGVLSRMLTLAEVWEMRPEGVNPCRFVKKYPEHKPAWAVAAPSAKGRNRESAHPRPAAQLRQRRVAGRRGPSDDREAARAQQGADHRLLRSSRE